MRGTWIVRTATVEKLEAVLNQLAQEAVDTKREFELHGIYPTGQSGPTEKAGYEVRSPEVIVVGFMRPRSGPMLT